MLFRAEFARLAQIRHYIKSSPPAQGLEDVLLPGEPEFRKWQLRVEARRETHDLTGGILDAAAIFSHKTKKMRYEATSLTL